MSTITKLIGLGRRPTEGQSLQAEIERLRNLVRIADLLSEAIFQSDVKRARKVRRINAVYDDARRKTQ